MAKNTNSIVEVKRKHIREGNPGDGHSCAVVLALDEKFTKAKKDVDDIFVSGDGINVNFSDGTSVNYEAPRSVARFITRFDASSNGSKTEDGRKVQKPAPFAFRLRKAS